jgi:hypothetical protein
MPPASPTATADVPVDATKGSRAQWFRRGFLTLLLVVVVAAFAGLLGVRSRTVHASARDGSVTLDVHYAQVARAGLDVPFEVTVRRAGGFDDDIVLTISKSYLDLFDLNSQDPEPSDSTASAATAIWTFTPPPGDTFVLSLDMQVQGGRHWGRAGAVSVVEDGRPVARAAFKTWLAP